jgi:hypothetical protein
VLPPLALEPPSPEELDALAVPLQSKQSYVTDVGGVPML